jgi:hypothetical protein
VLEKGATISGSVLLPTGLRPRDFLLALRNQTLNSTKTVRCDGNGSFAFDRLAAGTYDLEISARNRILLQFGDLAVQSGETLLDPRLEAIDLREVAHSPGRIGARPVPR